VDKPRFIGLRWPDSTTVVVFSQRPGVNLSGFQAVGCLLGSCPPQKAGSTFALAPVKLEALMRQGGVPRSPPETILFCKGRIFRGFALAS
jgi:hypothetical protein